MKSKDSKEWGYKSNSSLTIMCNNLGLSNYKRTKAILNLSKSELKCQ